MVRSTKQAGSSGGNRSDPAWKYCVEIKDSGENRKSYKYVKCNFCSKRITGGVRRLKDHLGGTHKNVAPCCKVPKEVKNEMLEHLKSFNDAKKLAQSRFEEMIDVGSHFVGPNFEERGSTNAPATSSGPSGTISTRGVRGPIDRFLVSEPNPNEEGPSKETQISPPPANAKEHRNQVCLDIGRFFFENGIPFNVARSPSFVSMVRSIGLYGRGLKPPSMHEISSWILREEYKNTESCVADIKKTWPSTGVSILSDGWTDIRGRTLINFLVNNPYGTIFLRSVDASDSVKDANLLFKMLDDIVEEIGENLVVQVVTDNASAYKLAGQKLMEKRKHLYWTPCAAHCLDLMLEDLGKLPQHRNALLKGKRVTKFIYNHAWVLSLMRKFTKRDLIRPAATRFASAFLTLESLYRVKDSLHRMFVSTKWTSCKWAHDYEGKQVKKIIVKDNTFWSSVVYALKTTKPLVQVLRLADSEGEPAMGFIYNAMDMAKEEIAKNLGGEEGSYREIWDIIDKRWDFQLHRDLHAAAYFLNPRYKYEPGCSEHREVYLGLLKCMERMIPSSEDHLKADVQLDEYRYKRGLFGYTTAQASYKKRPPVEWWDLFGVEVPELRSFAMRVLGLTCSASACERNWSIFNQVHTKRRNRLSTLKMNNLVYIMYNRKLKLKHLNIRARKGKEDEETLFVEDLSSDNEWLVDENDEVLPSPVVHEEEEADLANFDQREFGGGESSRKTHKGQGSREALKGKRLQLMNEESDEWEDGSDEEVEDDRAIRYDDDSLDDPTSDDANDE